MHGTTEQSKERRKLLCIRPLVCAYRNLHQVKTRFELAVGFQLSAARFQALGHVVFFLLHALAWFFKSS